MGFLQKERRIVSSLQHDRKEFMGSTRKTQKLVTYALVATVSLLVFISIYGVNVLNPTYTDWLMAGGDARQHYMGWNAFRTSEWLFPFGLENNLAYPYKVSVIFTDSLPLFAIILKYSLRFFRMIFNILGSGGGILYFTGVINGNNFKSIYKK